MTNINLEQTTLNFSVEVCNLVESVQPRTLLDDSVTKILSDSHQIVTVRLERAVDPDFIGFWNTHKAWRAQTHSVWSMRRWPKISNLVVLVFYGTGHRRFFVGETFPRIFGQRRTQSEVVAQVHADHTAKGENTKPFSFLFSSWNWGEACLPAKRKQLRCCILCPSCL